MARKSIIDTYYTFVPSTRTITIPRAIPRERLVLITDVTTNTVIYNFSDATLKATSYAVNTDATGANTVTTIVLNYNTSALGATDKLQIIVDEYDEKFTPSETYLDAVNKMRVSMPQSLIDTDYEYSTQSTKWENLALVNNRPFAYYNVTQTLPIADITATNGSRTFTVTTNGVFNPPLGSAVVIIDSGFAGADGVYIVDTISGGPTGAPMLGTTFTYTGKFFYTGTTGSINVTGQTAVYFGGIYSNSAIQGSALTSVIQGSLTGSFYPVTVTVGANFPHGLLPGNEIAVTGIAATANAPTGSYVVSTTASPTTMVYYNTAAANPTTSTITGSLTSSVTVKNLNTLGNASLSATTHGAGALITAPQLPANTYITAVNIATGATATATGTTLTVSGAATSGYFANGAILTGTSITPATEAILTQLTATNAADATGTFLSAGQAGQNTVQVTMTLGTVKVGHFVTGTNIPAGSYVGSITGEPRTTGGTQAPGLPYLTLVNYLGSASNFTATATGTLTFQLPGSTGTYQLSQSWTSGTITGASGLTLSQAALSSSNAVTATFNACVFPRPGGTLVHRPQDGGVRFSTNAASHNHQFIRQTRRYFRYQSGKAIQMSTGTTLKPQMNIDGITSTGTGIGSTVTVSTKDPHNIVAGVTIQIAGCDQPGYNGQYVIVGVISPYQFTYTLTQAVTSTTATGQFVGSATNWYGNSNRIGIYDSQNGMFFEYDGQTLWAVRRHSIYQIAGAVTTTAGSSLVTSTGGISQPTTFSKQLQTNDFIVIKGMTYRVQQILSDTQMLIMPPWRGTSGITGAQVSKVIDIRIPQSAWNIDRCDGTGPTGYNLDLTRMQMFYIDYSWYGSGFIRYGVRATDGNVAYMHKFINNNVNYLSYMRSGNLPGRYESLTFTKYAQMVGGATGPTSNLSTIDSIMYVTNTYQWPASGTIHVRSNTAIEYMNYGGINAVATLTGSTTVGSPTITMANTSGIIVGQYISGYGFRPEELVTVQSINTNTSILVSKPAYASATTTFLFNPYLQGLVRGQAGNTALASVTITQGSNTITNVSSTSGLQLGQYVLNSNIPPQSYIVGIVSNTSITVTQAATGSAASATITIPPLASAAQSFIYSSVAPVVVELHAPQFASEVSHWGTSAIIDGTFTNDKQFIFTRGMATTLTVSNGVTQPVMSLRAAPSASNGIPAQNIGIREIITRMQVVLQQADVLSNGNFLMQLILNGVVNDGDQQWVNTGGSSMTQYAFHTQGSIINGGEIIFGFYLNTNGTTYSSTQQDLTQVRDLGTSILSGGYLTLNNGVYPDGPDIVTLICKNLSTATGSSQLQARLSWVEAQA